MDAGFLILAGFALIVVGLAAVFGGTLLASKDGKTDVRGGGVIFLGPIPIVFGTDKRSAVTVAVIALVLMIAYYVFFRR